MAIYTTKALPSTREIGSHFAGLRTLLVALEVEPRVKTVRRVSVDRLLDRGKRGGGLGCQACGDSPRFARQLGVVDGRS
jgi:hypothetical protein